MKKIEQYIISIRLIYSQRVTTIEHLLSENNTNWFSGFLEEIDIQNLEEHLNKKIRCSVESGEYFYKVE